MSPDIEPDLIKGRMRLLGSFRRYLEEANYQEVQTPILHGSLGGFEKGTGFSTFSSSLGERLWFRGAPELYLKRLMIGGQGHGMDRVFELATCLRDEYNEGAPRTGYDRPELTLLELYETSSDDPWSLEELFRGMIDRGITVLEADGLLGSRGAEAVGALRGTWQRQDFNSLLQTIDAGLDLERLQKRSVDQAQAMGVTGASLQAQAIEARAGDADLRETAANLAYRGGDLAQYLRAGPQGYWYDFIDHAFQTQVAPTLMRPVIVHGLPLESSPLAASTDGIHCDKWELYMGGVRIALAQRELMDAEAQRVRFKHLDHLRAIGYELLPEPDEAFIAELERWPANRPLIGMGVYVDRLAGIILGILAEDGTGQERMIPNLFKGPAS